MQIAGLLQDLNLLNILIKHKNNWKTENKWIKKIMEDSSWLDFLAEQTVSHKERF